jgi:LPS-assembly lipoprotein
MRHKTRLGALLPSGLVLGVAVAMLAGCGFHPMYAPSANGGPAIGPVVVDQIDTKAGHLVKAELEKLLQVERNAGGAPQRLKVSVSESSAGLGFRVDESASRSDLLVSASYALYAADGKEVLRGAASAGASYDIPNSAYGEIAAQDDARERAAENVAEKLRADIAVRLAQLRARQAAPTPP